MISQASLEKTINVQESEMISYIFVKLRTDLFHYRPNLANVSHVSSLLSSVRFVRGLRVFILTE